MRSDLVPDSGIWIQVMRHPTTWRTLEAGLRAGRIWLSSVAVAELYAGTRSREDGRILDRIISVLQGVDRLLVPTHAEWMRAGQLIGRRVRLQGALRPRDHLADVLIVLSAARLGGTVLTADVGHLEAWAALARSAGLDVVVSSFPTD